MSLRNPDERAPVPAPDQAPTADFPRDPEEFDSDPRISFSKLDNKFILETEDGQEFEYDTALKRWVQTVSSRRIFLRRCASPLSIDRINPFSSYFLLNTSIYHCLRIELLQYEES